MASFTARTARWPVPRIWALSALLVTPVGPGCAKNSPVPAAVDAGPLGGLMERSESPVLLREREGRFASLSLTLPREPGLPLEDRATRLFGALRPLLDLPAEVSAQAVATRPKRLGGSIVTLGLSLSGLPLLASSLEVHFDGDERVRFVGGRLPRGLAGVSPTPRIAEADARSRAASGFGEATVESLTLGLLDGALLGAPELGAQLVYEARVHVGVARDPVRYVSADNGAIILEYDRTARARSRRIYTLAGATVTTDAELEAARVLLLDESGPVAGMPTDADGDATHAHFGTLLDAYVSLFALDGWGGDEQVAYVRFAGNAPLHSPSANAIFVPDDQAQLDLLGHEVAHAVTASALVSHSGARTGLALAGDAAMLAEGLADTLGALVVDDGDRYRIGEGLMSGPIRDLANPGALSLAGAPYPTHVDDPTIESFEGMVQMDETLAEARGHFLGAIVGHAFHLLSEGGTHAETGIRVRGLGAERAAEIAFGTLTEYLTPSADRFSLRDGMREAALEMVRAGRLEPFDCASAIVATAAVGLGTGDQDMDCWADDEDNCLLSYNPDQDPMACTGGVPPRTAPCPDCDVTACSAEGSFCTHDDDCCPVEGSSVACLLEHCARIDGCGMFSVPCEPDTCCGTLKCRPVADPTDLRCCAGSAQSCEFDTDCCGTMTCGAGRCQCRREQESCIENGECCLGLGCDATSGRCVP